MSKEDAKDLIEEIEDSFEPGKSEAVELSLRAEQQLKDLGYR